MAAMRSALAMLGHRGCGSSGSSVAASMGGKGLEIHQVFRPGMPMLSGLRPCFHNLESSRHLGTGRNSADKAGGGLRAWWQRRVKPTDVAEGAKTAFYYRMFVLAISFGTAGKLLMDPRRKL